MSQALKIAEKDVIEALGIVKNPNHSYPCVQRLVFILSRALGYITNKILYDERHDGNLGTEPCDTTEPLKASQIMENKERVFKKMEAEHQRINEPVKKVVDQYEDPYYNVVGHVYDNDSLADAIKKSYERITDIYREAEHKAICEVLKGYIPKDILDALIASKGKLTNDRHTLMLLIGYMTYDHLIIEIVYEKWYQVKTVRLKRVLPNSVVEPTILREVQAFSVKE